MKILSIGEILWDCFPQGKVWGGAPANFAFHAGQCGASAAVFSAVGDDDYGRELLLAVRESRVELFAEQVNYPTGIVDIIVIEAGVPD